MVSWRVFRHKEVPHTAVDMHSCKKKKEKRVTHRLPPVGLPLCFLRNSNWRVRLGKKIINK